MDCEARVNKQEYNGSPHTYMYVIQMFQEFFLPILTHVHWRDRVRKQFLVF